MLEAELLSKYEALKESLNQKKRLAVAFSAGVDSTLLLKIAHDELGDNVIAITAASKAVPKREIDEAIDFCKNEGVCHVIVQTSEFDIEGFDRNPPDRCYLCKSEILGRIFAAAHENGFDIVAEGSNVSDAGDFRPGARAIAEQGAVSPLRDAGFTKADVRALARHLNLSVWDKVAFACLNTRFAFGELLTPERLSMVDSAEEFIRDLGFPQVRVRVQGDLARIEVPTEDIARIASSDVRKPIATELKRLGFAYVSLDLQGYRMGSMNEALHEKTQ